MLTYLDRSPSEYCSQRPERLIAVAVARTGGLAVEPSFSQARLCITVRSLPQKMAAQWGMGSTHVLTRHVRAVGHEPRVPIDVFALATVSTGAQ